jgi:hypothetical protein
MFLYHQTSVKVVGRILKEGLKSHPPDEWKGLLDGLVPEGTPVVWFTDNIRPLGSYLHPAKCLVRVETSWLIQTRLVLIRKPEVRGWWVYMGDIPTAAISLVPWQHYRRTKPKWWSKYEPVPVRQLQTA